MSIPEEIQVVIQRERAKRRRLRNLRLAITGAFAVFGIGAALLRPAAAGPLLVLVAILVVTSLVSEYLNREDA